MTMTHEFNAWDKFVVNFVAFSNLLLYGKSLQQWPK